MPTKANLNKKELPYRKELEMDMGFLSKNEVAAYLRVSPSTVDRYVRKGLLTLKKIGCAQQSRCFFDKTEVLNLIPKLLSQNQ